MVTDLTKTHQKAYACPACAKWNQPEKLFVQGIHVLADCRCRECGLEYFHTLPVAHARDLPVSFSKDGKISDYSLSKARWLAEPLIGSMTDQTVREVEVTVQKQTDRNQQQAILINCLDDCFGHVFTKLCNLSVCRNRHPDSFLIALLPERMAWLLPPQADEAWLIPGPLENMARRIGGLDAWIREQLPRFESCYLHEVSMYADPVDVDFEQYLKKPSFDYSARKILPLRVAFILREDRFWLTHGWEEFLYKVVVKFRRMPSWKAWFCKKQNKRVLQATKKLQVEFPEIDVLVTGIGTYGTFPEFIKDLRRDDPLLTDEQSWLEALAGSHVAVGIHGSNMIIPGIQAGGMVEIVPSFKVAHIGETTMKDYPSRLLCRHLTDFPGPGRVADTVIGVIKVLKGPL